MCNGQDGTLWGMALKEKTERHCCLGIRILEMKKAHCLRVQLTCTMAKSHVRCLHDNLPYCSDKDLRLPLKHKLGMAEARILMQTIQ